LSKNWRAWLPVSPLGYRTADSIFSSPFASPFAHKYNFLEFSMPKMHLRLDSVLNLAGKTPAILAQFTLEMCVANGNPEKFTKPPKLGVQDRSRPLMLIQLKSSSPLLVMIGSMSVPICNRFNARRANRSKKN